MRMNLPDEYKEVTLTRGAIGILSRTIPGCVYPTPMTEPLQNKKRLFEISKNGNLKDVFSFNELVNVKIGNSSVLPVVIRKIVDATGDRSITEETIIAYFSGFRHVNFNLNEIEHSNQLLNQATNELDNWPLFKDFILADVLCLCKITAESNGLFEGSFIDPDDYSSFKRKVAGLVNLSGEEVKSNDLVLVHFATIISAKCPPDFATKLFGQYDLLGYMEKLKDALRNEESMDYRNWAGRNITEETIKIANQVMGSDFS